MPHKIKNCFYAKLTFEKLLQAHNRAKKHKCSKDEVIRFELNLENNLINLLNNIKNNTYQLGTYKEFKVYEPKERIIKSLPYIDRIVHQWYVEEFIKPYLVPKFIHTTYACLTDRGTHKAVEKVQKFMQLAKRNYQDFWVLKCDIKGFFYHIDKKILFQILQKNINDKKLIQFTKQIIFDNTNINKKGIPIGNYTSQFFANIYLNELDQYVKHVLHIKYYVRYMDDFILLTSSKEEAKKLKLNIENFLHEHLELELNHKSRYYPYEFGVNFCGYRIFPTHKLLRTDSKKKIKRKIITWNKLYKQNKLNLPKAVNSINSWIGHASHCNSYLLQQKIFRKCNFLYTDKTIEDIESDLISLYKNN